MNKAAQIIKNLSQGVLISGILSALMGAYYLFAKAGLPLQDPPLALKIQYEIDFGVGEKMLMLGITCLFIGCVGYTVAWICSKTEKVQDPSDCQAGRPSRPNEAN